MTEAELLDLVLDEATTLTGLPATINLPPWTPTLTVEELLPHRVDYVLSNLKQYVQDLRTRVMRLTEREQMATKREVVDRYQAILAEIVKVLPSYLQSNNWDELPRAVAILARRGVGNGEEAGDAGRLTALLEEIRQTIPEQFQPRREEPEKLSRALNTWAASLLHREKE